MWRRHTGPPPPKEELVAVLRRGSRIIYDQGKPLTPLRHLVAIAVLPCTVAILIPIWIARHYAVEVALPASTGGVLLAVWESSSSLSGWRSSPPASAA